MSTLSLAKRTSLVLAGGVVLLAAFGAVLLASYRMRPTVATTFLVIGWASLVATGWFLAQAISALEGKETSWLADEARAGGRRREDLLREKKLLLKAIKEIEFDQAMGKIDEADAAAAVSRYRARALEIIAATDETSDGDARAAVERELSRRLVQGGVKAQAGRCTECLTTNDADATFCKKCGVRLYGREVSA